MVAKAKPFKEHITFVYLVYSSNSENHSRTVVSYAEDFSLWGEAQPGSNPIN